MVEAIIIARRFLSDYVVITTCDPGFVEATFDGVERSAIRFTVRAVTAITTR